MRNKDDCFPIGEMINTLKRESSIRNSFFFDVRKQLTGISIFHNSNISFIF